MGVPDLEAGPGRDGLAALLASPSSALVAFDYDGTLAPIVDDPAQARPGPRAVASLARLSGVVGLVAVVTGRPAQVAADLAGFASTPGLDSLIVMGHYGMERWEARTGELTSVEAPPGVAQAHRRLPGLLADLGLEAADIEDKQLSVAVHVRRLPDPAAAYATLVGPLEELAASVGLVAEPGRQVVELRPPGMDKGRALRALVAESGATSVTFVGDDLGDLAAFAEVERLRSQGLGGLLVCSGSTEVTALAERADIVVDGPDGVSELVDELVDAITA